MILRCLNRIDLDQIRIERNKDISGFRTPYLIIDQAKFWDLVIDANKSRYFAIQEDDLFVGYCGLYPISWENSSAEVSLHIFENYRKSGKGSLAFKKLVEVAFNQMNLNIIYGECYKNNPGAVKFWEKQKKVYKYFKESILPDRKYWDGYYYDSYYFSINRKLL